MRFKAVVKDALTLSLVVQSLERMAPAAVLLLAPESVRLYVTSHYTQGEQAFVDLPVKTMFDNYRIESKSDNEIPLLISLPNLARAVRSGERATSMMWKLVKKHEKSYLTIDIKDAVDIRQDVAVTIMPLKKIYEEYQEPELPQPNVQVRLPNPNSLRAVVDRMRAVSDEIVIEATATGQVTFTVRTPMVQIRTFYKGMQLHSQEHGSDAGGNAASARACLDIRKLFRVLNCRTLPCTYTLACIVEEHAFVVFAKLKEGKGGITYYIPLIQDEKE